MKGLREKFRKHEGFTLVEMLIVVAIIAILIAVSIPLVTSALDKAKDAVDDANKRSAVALATIEYLTNTATYDALAEDSPKQFVYKVETDSKQGSLVAGTSGGVASQKDSSKTLQVTIGKGGAIKADFAAGSSTPTNPDDNQENEDGGGG